MSMAQELLWDLSQLIARLQSRKLLLVCGRSFDLLPIAGEILALDPVIFRDFQPNPLYEDVCKGLDLYRSTGCDAILAVGGGSAMDTAKCIKLFAGMDDAQNYLQLPFADSGILLAAIPTPAGTGSESTRHAVIYYQGEKQSISHSSLVPQYACLLPQVLKGLPLYQKKCTLLDALCQAIESWWSVNSTQESIAFSREAIVLIRDNWQAYLNGNEGAAEAILLASNLSGRAINITATTAAHAMSYKLTSLYGIPHGHAVALCLPLVWDAMLTPDAQCTDPRGMAHLQSVLGCFPVDLPWFRQLLQQLELSRPTAGDRSREIALLTASVNPIRLKNNPVLLDRDTLQAMYERIVL